MLLILPGSRCYSVGQAAAIRSDLRDVPNMHWLVGKKYVKNPTDAMLGEESLPEHINKQGWTNQASSTVPIL